MKKLKFLITLSLVSLFWLAGAQKSDYIPLLDTGKVWYTAIFGEFGQIFTFNMTPDFENVCNANDTIYIRIDGYITIREDTLTKKVYKRNFTDNNTPSGPEEMIYDFSLQEGDSINFPHITNMCSSSGWFYIDSIRTKSYFGFERNIFYLNNHYPNAPNTIWIEGIGSLGGVENFNAFPMIWECGELTCCYLNDELLYQSAYGEEYGCEFELVDQVPPVVDSIWYDPGPYNNTDTVTLFVKAWDNLSGVSSYFIRINSPSGSPSGNYIDHYGSLTHVADDIYSSKIRYNWNEIGNWYSDFIVVWDNDGNYTEKHYDYQASFNVDELNGVEEKKIKDIELYPNPVAEISILSFENPENNQYSLIVYNVLGKQIKLTETNGSFFKIKKTDYAQGIYIYQLINNKHIIYSNKFTIQ